MADVFNTPQLRDMASAIRPNGHEVFPQKTDVEPVMLLGKDVSEQDIRRETSSLCGKPPDEIEDVFPCTLLQEGLIALTFAEQRRFLCRSMADPSPFQH